ncbi:general transcription factor II-I repeat domain-containing protein 2B-like [Daktulosphaira vitifoliae]|uniref:general transcription factor II-I repeat domain-containing protein 2B-like n=1 Tax=Daktulosphaira vitifoliae TaxID=58002 RepID=UPI0021AAD67B|nr:general transcription factor II-I repeat domain-containing protein 2B-like [Daktulosphaira vitifoliae]
MYKYFFIQFNEKPTCLICRESVAVYKEFNIQRHYETKHKSKYESIKDKARESKLELLKKKFADETSAVKSMFSRQVKGKDDIVTASYKIANLIAKDQQALNSGEFIKKCIIAAIEEIAPEKCSAFKEISLSRPTITRRIEDIGKNLQDQMQTKAEQFSFFSLALDESTDNRDTAQLLIFVRGIDREFTITEELASLQSMKDRTSADDLFEDVLQCITKLNLNWKNLCGLTTDGAPSMIGSKNGLVTKILHQMATQNLEQPLPVHCIIHQQALCCKVLEMDHVMNVVRDIVNFIRSRGLNHRQFQAFLEEVGSEFSDVLYHNQIRWLSRAQMDEAVVQENFQMEIIELKTNTLQKDLYEENRKNLPNFYKNLDDDNFPELKKLAQRVFTMFGSTYLCEQTFSRMKCIKSKERSRLTDDHLRYLLRAATTKFEPDIKKLALQKQPQVSH